MLNLETTWQRVYIGGESGIDLAIARLAVSIAGVYPKPQHRVFPTALPAISVERTWAVEVEVLD